MTLVLPEPVIKVAQSDFDRFWAKVDRSGECWLWTAHVGRWGYGQFGLAGAVLYAHVVAHLWFVGPIPEGWEVDHVKAKGCKHKHCVRPAHLEAATSGENQRRSESASGKNSRADECPEGHKYDEANTYIEKPKGTRRCRKCMVAQRKQYDQQHAEERRAYHREYKRKRRAAQKAKAQ